MAEKLSVRICLGSSCCSRGNGKNLVVIREFIEKNGLAGSIDFRGSVCAGKCGNGPVIEINGKVYEEADALTIIDVLKKELKDE